MLPQLFAVAALERTGVLVPRNDVPQEVETSVVVRLDVADQFGHFVHPLCPPIGRFERHDHAVGGTQRRHAHERQARRAVDDDQVVEGTQRAEGIDQRVCQN